MGHGSQISSHEPRPLERKPPQFSLLNHNLPNQLGCRVCGIRKAQLIRREWAGADGNTNNV